MTHDPSGQRSAVDGGRVFITGALGFIGGALADRYRQEGWEISGVDVRADPERGVVAGDIATPGVWQDHAAGAQLVIHTAAIVSNAYGGGETWKTNVLGTRHVVDAAARGGVRRLVHFSSVRAFSDLHYPAQADERWPVRPDGNAYVDTKVASEHVVLQAHAAGEIAATIVRPGDVYGPGCRPWILVPLEAMKAGRFALPRGGRGVFTPIYIDDLVRGVRAAAETSAASGQVLTLAHPQSLTTGEFFGHLARMLGVKPPPTPPTPVLLAGAAAVAAGGRLTRRRTETNPTAVRYFMRTGVYSTDKARDLLGFEAEIGLEEGMRRVETWLREEGLLRPRG